MLIKTIAIDDIRPAKYNPRKDLKPTDAEYKRIEASLDTFGLLEPLVWNCRTKNLVGGHQRLKVLIQKGVTQVEVSVVDLNEDQEKALNLALNKVQGAWDEDKLATLLQELTTMPELDIALTGFGTTEISSILDEYFEPKDDSFDFDGAVGSIGEPVTKSGDILVLGPHRVMCGDATVLGNVERLFEGEKAALYWSDWPYNVTYDAANRPGAAKSLWDPIQNDSLPEDQYLDWMKKVLKVTSGFLIDGCPVYIWNGHRQFWSMHQALKEAGIYPASVLTWKKPGFSPSFCDYQFATEFLLYGWKEGAAHPFYGSAESTLWEVRRDPAKTLLHPTQKPVELPQRAIRNSSRRGEIVFDSCLGSGSALIAAEGLGRRCFGLEIEPKYCDAIVRRYLVFAGKDKVSDDIKSRYLKEVSL